MIVETYDLVATDTDVLAAPSRLAAIPHTGRLILEFQASVAVAADHFDVTISLPNGDVPLRNVWIPEGVNAGSINMNEKYQVSFAVNVGGHVTINATMTGTSILEIRATLMP